MTRHLTPFARPLYVMAKPIGAVCNLACDYCYYLEKRKLYPEAESQVMNDRILEQYIRSYIEAQTTEEVLFTWHGGETLMRPLSFYRKVIELQKRYARGHQIANSLQTNGTLLNDEWCKFFKDNNFLIGISIDGPQIYHDTYRCSRQGLPSYYRVMKGIELLKKHHVEYNAMAVVNDLNVNDPIGFYNFFKQIDCHYIQFTPIVERLAVHADGTQLTTPDEVGELAPFSVDPDRWGDFLCTLFDEWIKEDVGKYFIQIFDATLAGWVGQDPGICTFGRTCGHAAVMEYNGDIYTCDHFVFPQYKLGNIMTHSITEMMYGQRQQQFGEEKITKLPTQCRNCEYLFACHGECPKNRFLFDANGEPGLNYLCRGYHRYFRHVAPYMDFMKHELLASRAPANVMQWAKEHSKKKDE